MSGRSEPGKTSNVQDVNALEHELAYVARVARCSSPIDELLQDSLKRSQLFSTARDLGSSLFGCGTENGPSQSLKARPRQGKANTVAGGAAVVVSTTTRGRTAAAELAASVYRPVGTVVSAVNVGSAGAAT